MNTLDFGSGGKNVLEPLWLNNSSGIEALKRNTTEQINQLTIFAFDPIEITSESTLSSQHVAITFCVDFGKIPNNLDTICVLHPNPLVLLGDFDPYDPESHHYGVYIPWLVQAIEKNLKFGGRIMLQFDTELEGTSGGGAKTFIDLLNQLLFPTAVLKEITRKTDHPEFPCGVYDFSSFWVLEKEVREKKSRGKIKKRR